MADRLTEMTCFVRTVETGSFATAGRSLGMPPQIVGRHVAALEERLGVQLLVRTTRRHSLTEAGQLFFDRCRAVVRDADEAEMAVTDGGGAARGQLTISAPATLGSTRLMPFVARYLEDNPAVGIKLVLTDRPVDVVGERFDAVIRIGPLADSTLIARRLPPVRLRPCAAPDYLRRCGAPERPADLARHECLIYDPWFRPPFATWRFEREGVPHEVTVSGRLQINDGRSLIAAAVAGAGIALQDLDVILPHVARGELALLLPDFQAPARELNLIYPPGRFVSPKLRSFVDALATHMHEAAGGSDPIPAGSAPEPFAPLIDPSA